MKFKRDKGKGSEWVDWLRDEPLPSRSNDKTAAKPWPQEPAKTAPVTHGARVGTDARTRLRNAGISSGGSAGGTPNKPAISIHISLPNIRFPKLRLKYTLPRKQIAYWGAFTAVVVGLSVGTRGLLELAASTGDKPGKTEVKGSSTTGATKPSFTPAVPKDKKELASSNSSTSRYIPSRQLYTYVDTLLGSQITVSEQPLPQNLKDNTKLLQQTAASIGAKDKFETAFGTVYVATSENHTSQRVVFVHQDLLVFIESIKTYDNDAWKLYVESLR